METTWKPGLLYIHRRPPLPCKQTRKHQFRWHPLSEHQNIARWPLLMANLNRALQKPEQTHETRDQKRAYLCHDDGSNDRFDCTLDSRDLRVKHRETTRAVYFGSFFLNMSRSRALCLAALAPDNAPSLASSFMTSPRLPCRRAMPSVRTTPTASGTHIGGRLLVTSSPTCHVRCAFDLCVGRHNGVKCRPPGEGAVGWVGAWAGARSLGLLQPWRKMEFIDSSTDFVMARRWILTQEGTRLGDEVEG